MDCWSRGIARRSSMNRLMCPNQCQELRRFSLICCVIRTPYIMSYHHQGSFFLKTVLFPRRYFTNLRPSTAKDPDRKNTVALERQPCNFATRIPTTFLLLYAHEEERSSDTIIYVLAEQITPKFTVPLKKLRTSFAMLMNESNCTVQGSCSCNFQRLIGTA